MFLAAPNSLPWYSVPSSSTRRAITHCHVVSYRVHGHTRTYTIVYKRQEFKLVKFDRSYKVVSEPDPLTLLFDFSRVWIRDYVQGNLFLLAVYTHEVPLYLCSIFCSRSQVRLSTASHRVWSADHAPFCSPYP